MGIKISGTILQLLQKQTGVLNAGQLAELRGKPSPVSKAIDLILADAVHNNAGAVHFEPGQTESQLRYRIDNLLCDFGSLPNVQMQALTAKLKAIAKLDISEQNLPQNGSFKQTIGKDNYILQISTLPVLEGEKLVINICPAKPQLPTFDQLGFWGQNLRSLQAITNLNSGVVFTTGTSSVTAKNSLFGLVNGFLKPGLNMAILDDQPTYRIPGINQTKIDDKYSLNSSDALSACLRQEPAIIAINSIKNSQTAKLVVDSALSGKLMLAALAAPDSASCLSRLEAMGLETHSVAASTKAIICQRQLPKLCQYCKAAYKPKNQELTTNLAICGVVSKQDLIDIIKVVKDLDGKITPKLWQANPEGCKSCNNTGYKGYVLLGEILINSPRIQTAIIAGSSPEEIRKIACREGMISLAKDGVIKSLMGLVCLTAVAQGEM